MPRPEKVQAVADIKERIERAKAVFLAEYAGLSVKDQQTLRRNLREGGAEFKVVKMTLARRAADELELEGVDGLLLGPTGLTFADGDPVTAAKALKDFAIEHEVFAIKGGLLGTDFLTPERVSELADIEPRDVLLAKIAGAAKAPMANLAGLLAALPRNFASMLSQLVEKKGPGDVPAPDDSGPAEEAETVEEEAAADDATPEAETAVEDAETAEEDTAAETEAEANTSDEAEAAAAAPVTDDDAPAADTAADDAVTDADEAEESAPEADAATEEGAKASDDAEASDDATEDDETADAEPADADASVDEEE